MSARSSALPLGPCAADFTHEEMVKIDGYLIKVFGFKLATQIKLESNHRKDLIKTIMIKELARTFKFAEAAY